MNILYVISTGEIICFGSMPNIEAGSGQAVSIYMGNTIPVIGLDKFDGNDFYR